MEIDRIDEAVLALLYLTLDRDGRAWKGFDWGAMNRLHPNDSLGDLNEAISVWLTQEGVAQSEKLFGQLFCRPEYAAAAPPGTWAEAPWQVVVRK